MTENTPVPLDRTERVLAFMVASIGGLSVVSILSVIVASLLGVRDFSTGIWPIALVLPFVGLPITAMLLIAFFVVRALHQRRIARGGGH